MNNAPPSARANIIEVRDLRVAFDTPGGALEALRGINFRIRERETVALVGESGSGKSVTAQVLMGLLPRVARIAGGEVLFRDPKTGNRQRPRKNFAGNGRVPSHPWRPHLDRVPGADDVDVAVASGRRSNPGSA